MPDVTAHEDWLLDLEACMPAGVLPAGVEPVALAFFEIAAGARPPTDFSSTQRQQITLWVLRRIQEERAPPPDWLARFTPGVAGDDA